MSAPLPQIARMDADLQRLTLKREADARMKRLAVAAQQYDVDHLDVTSQYRLPGSYPVDYLHLGGAA